MQAKNILYEKLNELYNLKNNSERDELYTRVSKNMEESLEYYRKATKLNWYSRVAFPNDFIKAKGLESDYDGIKFVLEEMHSQFNFLSSLIVYCLTFSFSK